MCFLSVHSACVVAKSESRSKASTSYTGLGMLRSVYADRCTCSVGGCECGSVSSWFLRWSLAIVKSVGPSTEGSASMHIEVSYCPVKVSSGQFSYGYGSIAECVGILDVTSLVLNTGVVCTCFR